MKYLLIVFSVVAVLLSSVVSYAQSVPCTLTWDVDTPNVTNYKVYRSQVSGSYLAAPVILGTVTTYDCSRVGNGTTDYFTVTAVNAGGESGKSNEVFKLFPIPPPPPPANLKVTQADSKHVVVAWSNKDCPTVTNVRSGTAPNKLITIVCTP